MCWKVCKIEKKKCSYAKIDINFVKADAKWQTMIDCMSFLHIPITFFLLFTV